MLRRRMLLAADACSLLVAIGSLAIAGAIHGSQTVWLFRSYPYGSWAQSSLGFTTVTTARCGM